MNINEGAPVNTIEKERSAYLLMKLKEMLEDSYYTSIIEKIVSDEETNIESYDSIEELLKFLKTQKPELKDEIDLWFEVSGLKSIAEVESFWAKEKINLDLENIKTDILREFDETLEETQRGIKK